jgi:hypothetical protein
LAGFFPLFCTSAVLLTLVVLPSREALLAWFDSQFDTLLASHCADTAYAPLVATYDHQRNGPVATLETIAFVSLFVGLGVEIISIYWINWRPRAGPGGQ